MPDPQARLTEREAIRVMLVEDNPGDAVLIKRTLQLEPGRFSVSHSECLSELLATSDASDVDIILLDLSLPDSHGLETLRRTREGAPGIPIVILTGLDDDETALAALREGAQDYCVKGRVDEEPLLRIMQYAIERKRFEKLADTVERSERLAALGQLAAGVAHEINNPATYLIANLEAMKQYTEKFKRVFAALRDPSTPLDASGQKFVGTLLADARVDDALDELDTMVDNDLGGMERVRIITSELKSFSRIDGDDAEWIQLNDVVTSACTMASNEIRHRAKLATHLGDIPLIAAHRGKLAQAILNVVINAAQWIEAGAADANRITVSTRHESGRVIVTVEDTGVGMSREDKLRIYEPFFTTKSREVGTGLGLTLCAETIRQHGGEIEVWSVLGEGTRFELILPRDTGLLAIPTGAASRNAVGGDREPVWKEARRARVLVVDDDQLVRSVLVQMLKVDHEVLEASGGYQALELLESDDDFDVILCDLMMPNGDGVMLFEALSRKAPRLCGRVVFLSGGAFTPRAREFIGKEGVRLLAKPMCKADLMAAVADVVGAVPARDSKMQAVGR